jgi:hypothetical protein
MLAGGMTIAAPSMVPEVHAANATLFVSAENSTYNNTFGGAQVVEIVVSNPDINRLDHGMHISQTIPMLVLPIQLQQEILNLEH